MSGRRSFDTPGRTPYPPRTPSRDLSNMKLAQNQTELSRQIDELRETVEMQGKMLQRLLEKLDAGADAVGSGKGKEFVS